MSKQIYISDTFIEDIQKYPIIFGFKLYCLTSNETDITKIGTTTNAKISIMKPVEFVNQDNKNESLVLSSAIAKLDLTDNYVVYTYLPISTVQFDSTTNINLINTFYKTSSISTMVSEKKAFVFKWTDSNNANILTMISNSNFKLIVNLKKYRVFSNFMSITENDMVHSHQFNTSNLSENEFNFKTLQGLSTKSDYNLQGISGYEYIENTEYTPNTFDFPYESFINDLQDTVL